ncbi:MAG: hypothetical protein HY690_18735 [Chloroflexi bacterium]|nr:hypothetical protein [Chloroflexota bacterium]
MPQQRGTGPRVAIEPAAHRPGAVAGVWLVAWRLQNPGPRPLQVLAARAPHGRFRSQERALAPPPMLLPGESAEIELAVTCAEPPGTVVENAFLILRVRWGSEPWRILARLRVMVDEAGSLRTTCEEISVQPIGFSGART